MKEIAIFLSTTLLFWPSYFLLNLILFRQKVKAQIRLIVIGSFIMGQVTLAVQVFPIQQFMSILQPMIYVLCLIVLFRIHLFHAVIMTVVSFICALFEEFALNAVVTGFVLEDAIARLRDSIFLAAFILTAINIVLAFLFYKYRIGFSFIKTNLLRNHEDASVQSDLGINTFISLAFVTLFCICVYRWPEYLIYDIVGMGLFFIVLMRNLIRKEVED